MLSLYRHADWWGPVGGGRGRRTPQSRAVKIESIPPLFLSPFFSSSPPPLLECPDVNINTERKRNGDHDVCFFSSSLANRCGLVVRWVLASLCSVGVMVALRNKAGDV